MIKQNNQKDREGEHKEAGQLADHEFDKVAIMQPPGRRHGADEFFGFHI
jgi:hypothetical protein